MPKKDSGVEASRLIQIIILLAIVIFAGSAWLWWNEIRMNADNVFWSMVNNNLSSASVTRHVVQSGNGKSIDEYIRAQFGAINATHTTVTLTQTSNQGKDIIKSESIGTPDNDYSRYISISTPQKTAQGESIDTSKVVGVWGKSSNSKNQPSGAQYFQQSILTIIPYGNFNQAQRQALINQMHTTKVYNISSSSAKSSQQNGHSVYVYQVDISPAPYIALMQLYARELGLGDIGLDPSNYASSPPLRAEITVDKLSRQMLSITYASTGQSEQVVDQNLFQPISLPTKTIPISDLQNRIQKIVQ